MATVPDPASGSIHQLEIGLMNQGAGVQGPVRGAVSKLAPGKVAELLIKRREEAVPGLRVPVKPVGEEIGNPVLRGRPDVVHTVPDFRWLWRERLLNRTPAFRNGSRTQ